jgi:hypothetical protein
MALVTVKYLGSTSTGRYHKYEVIPTITPAKPASGAGATEVEATPEIVNTHVAELTADGVEMNKNLGVTGFLSQTHLHTTPKVGDTVEADVRAFVKNATTTVNFFHGIDRAKQEAFASANRLNREFAEVASFAKKLEEFDISANDIKAFEEIKLLKERRKLITAQLKGLDDN